MRTRLALLLAFAALVGCGRRGGGRDDHVLRLAAESALVGTGLVAKLDAAFTKKTGYRVALRALPSRAAIDLARAGEVDAAITDAPGLELAALGDGFLAARTPFLRGELILVGPRSGAAAIVGATDAVDAMRRVAASGRKLVSRGDDSCIGHSSGLSRSSGSCSPSREPTPPVSLGRRA